jgi:hypothetical protein
MKTLSTQPHPTREDWTIAAIALVYLAVGIAFSARSILTASDHASLYGSESSCGLTTISATQVIRTRIAIVRATKSCGLER